MKLKDKEIADLQAWTAKVTGVKESANFLSLWNDHMLDAKKDAVPIVQMAYALMLDKPIIIVAPHGSRIPENVKRVARALKYFDADDAESLHAATLRAFKVVGIEPKH